MSRAKVRSIKIVRNPDKSCRLQFKLQVGVNRRTLTVRDIAHKDLMDEVLRVHRETNSDQAPVV